MLWDQILLDPWQDILYHPEVTKLDLIEENIDEITLEFIDGVSIYIPELKSADEQLLQKDPNHRLTEPCVTQHPFFNGMYVSLYDQS
jgi:hypothetical protein